MGKNPALFRLDNSEGVRESLITVDGKEKVRAWSSVLQIHGECIALTRRDAANLRGRQRPHHEQLRRKMWSSEDEREDPRAKCTRFQINYVPSLYPLLHKKLNELRKRRIPGSLGNDAQGCGIPAHPDLHKTHVESAIRVNDAERKAFSPFKIFVGTIDKMRWRTQKLPEARSIKEFKREVVPVRVLRQERQVYRFVRFRKNYGGLGARGLVGPPPNNRTHHNATKAENFRAHSKEEYGFRTIGRAVQPASRQRHIRVKVVDVGQ